MDIVVTIIELDILGKLSLFVGSSGVDTFGGFDDY